MSFIFVVENWIKNNLEELKDGEIWKGKTYEIDWDIFEKWENKKLKVKETPLKPNPSSPMSKPHSFFASQTSSTKKPTYYKQESWSKI